MKIKNIVEFFLLFCVYFILYRKTLYSKKYFSTKKAQYYKHIKNTSDDLGFSLFSSYNV